MEIFKTLGLLEGENSLWEKYSRQQLDLDDWNFQACSSVAQFRQQCDGLIEKIAKLLRTGNEVKTIAPINTQAAVEQFDRVGVRLAEVECDPLFGESCDDFAQAFWESVQQLVQIANDANALIVTDQNEYAKLEALEAYAEQWKKALSLALDRAYQAQKVDMMDAYERVCRIKAETEEALKRKGTDARE